MTQLTKEGWLLRTRSGNADEDTPMHFLQENKGKPPDPLQPQKIRPGKPEAKIPTTDSDREWQEWTLIEQWDGRLERGATWSDLRAALASMPPLPDIPRRDKEK
jgi:hypothetical protein